VSSPPTAGVVNANGGEQKKCQMTKTKTKKPPKGEKKRPNTSPHERARTGETLKKKTKRKEDRKKAELG